MRNRDRAFELVERYDSGCRDLVELPGMLEEYIENALDEAEARGREQGLEEAADHFRTLAEVARANNCPRVAEIAEASRAWANDTARECTDAESDRG